MPELEMWGGPECTVNRIGDSFRDQSRETGHHDRIGDLDLFAELGIKAIRYPILWERVAPENPSRFDWTWADARLNRLRELGIRPIVGLVHHGSGPIYTDLLSDSFAPGLAAYAAALAQRHPWIADWAPVNEPVTTARFSALYGHWYPHRRDEGDFWRALLNQIDGVRLAMAEIRRVNPAARMIQTDDLGRTYATAAVRDQAAFDNARRWMSWDLLCGRVVPGHPLWKRLCRHGLEDRLRAIADAPCPPDVIGVNHYLTSDRFLDHRVQRYPDHVRGDNGHQRFADTEAVRVLDPPPPGLGGVLREAWERYGLPLAVTEVHNGCTREEQMRWMANAWRTAGELREGGIDVRAVTSWALLGSCGWNTLLTQPGRYEPGAYDVSDGTPRATAMVALLRNLSAHHRVHPLADGDGWWRRPIRLHHPPVPRPAQMRDRASTCERVDPQVPVLLIVGQAGALADRVMDVCLHRGIACRWSDGVQVADAELIDEIRPWAVIAIDRPGLIAACAERAIPATDLAADEQQDGAKHHHALLDRLIDNAETAQTIDSRRLVAA